MLENIKSYFKGITKRWLISTFGVLLPIVILLIFFLSISVNSLCNNTIENALTGRINDLSNIFPGYACESTQDFMSSSTDYIKNFAYKDTIEMEVINASGRVAITSTGFEHDPEQTMPDYDSALQNSENFGKWTGKLKSGEKVTAITKIIHNGQGTPIGAIRYVVSLRKVGEKVFLVALISSLISVVVIFLVALSGWYFIRSIVNPVSEMGETAKKISQGDFGAKVNKMYDDEIGDLCDSINEMASELDAAEKMKNDFISRVSHELRTPLTAIKGWAETMRDGDIDRITFTKGMTAIVNESSRLKELVEELLDFSKLQSGRLTLNMARIDILAEVEEGLIMFKEKAASEGKHLLYDEPTDNLPAVYGDNHRLKQVFLIVLDNALKYTPKGGMIGVQVYHDYKDDMIKIIVADNGCGIDKDDLPKIKNKFYKANQKVDGSGIGLSVANEIINLHKGVLEIESSLDVGTTVTIGVPIYREYFNSVD